MGGVAGELAGISLGDDAARLLVEEDDTVADAHDAGQLMGDDDAGGAEGVANAQDELVQAAGGDRVEAC